MNDLVSDAAFLARLEFEAERRLRENRLKAYKPYPKVEEFHAMRTQERALIAANQVGKTYGAAMEVAMHLTGLYPSWWRGVRIDKAPTGWAAGVTSEATRDNPQRLLLGRVGEWGTGAIPKDRIEHIQKATHGIADSVDYIIVRHLNGHLARVQFKAYNQGREKFQGETLDFGWCDEEPPEDVYTEFLTRLNISAGPMLLTFTPLLGMSNVVKRFIIDKRPGTGYVSMTIADAEHYTPDMRKAIEAKYGAHEIEARTKGKPMLGSGRIYPVTQEALAWEPHAIPAHWTRIMGTDFGGVDHPAACASIAIDQDSDSVYVYDAWRAKVLFLEQASAFRARQQGWIPVAWPHDGNQHDRRSGITVAQQFRDEGINMLEEHAQWEEGGNSVEAGITLILTMMQSGRFRVASHLHEVFEEISLYHRKDGKVVKLADDLMDAIRIAVMMRRYAQTAPAATNRKQGSVSTWMS